MKLIPTKSRRAGVQLELPLYFCISLCNHYTMGRPSKTLDKDLADQLRQHMVAHSFSTADIGAALGVDKATISRSLKQNSFSREMRARVAAHLGNLTHTVAPHELLYKSLHLLKMSDKLRSDAERMIAEALDQMVARK